MERSAVRTGGALAMAGGALTAILMLVQPTFDGDLPRQLTSVANADYLSALDLASLLATLLALFGALAIIGTFRGQGAAEWIAGAARPLLLIGATLSLASTGLAMFAYRLIAQNFVLSTDANRQSVLDTAFGLNAAVYSLGTLAGLLDYGLAPLVLGTAIVLTGRLPRWLGALALLGGILEIIVCTISLLPGVSVDLASIDYLASGLIVTAIVGAGLLMFLRPARLTPQPLQR